MDCLVHPYNILITYVIIITYGVLIPSGELNFKLWQNLIVDITGS